MDFTADERGGKAAIARNVDFTADESGGKAAIASFPPLIVEENRKMRVCRPCKRR